MAVRTTCLLLLLGVMTTGCSWIGEEREYFFRKEWNEAKRYDWRRNIEDASGATELIPSPRTKRANAEKTLCMHHYGEQRVTSQNGISDSVGGRRCVLSPYPTGGHRLKGRGEG